MTGGVLVEQLSGGVGFGWFDHIDGAMKPFFVPELSKDVV